MQRVNGGVSRRDFISRIAKAGGAVALYETMTALGWLSVPEAFAGPPDLPAGSGNGQSVVILGAGIAGLTAALRLTEAGYECVILEAQGRSGGRNHTVRSGDRIYEETGFQDCEFDDDPSLYFNTGPARISHHHQALIALCRELNVKLQVFVLQNRGAYFLQENLGPEAVKNRQIVNDTRGYVAELLSKAVLRGTLDSELSYQERAQLLKFLEKFGDLKRNYSYEGSKHSGYITKPGAGTESGEIKPPLSLDSLLSSEFWNVNYFDPENFNWQPTMFEPVGGMDKIVDGLASRVGDFVYHNKEVCAIYNRDENVEIYYKDDFSGAINNIDADYCISTIPLPILRRIDTNFRPEFTQAMYDAEFYPTCKVAWQADHRFWEDESIYGGISWTDLLINQIWYPSSDYFAQKGVLVGAYNDGPDATEFGSHTFAERLRIAREQGAKIHPNFNEHVGRGISIAWHNVPHIGGGWADWKTNANGERTSNYQLLNQPEGRVYLGGSQLSYLESWQEGAVLSAYKIVAEIGVRVAQAVS